MKNFSTNLILSLSCIFIISIISIVQAQTAFNISNQATGDTLFSIDNDGNIGIGTTTPGATIEAKSDAVENGTTLSLGNSDDSHYLFMFSGRGGGSPLGPGFYWQDPDPLRFVTWDGQYNELMRLTANGNLGIGSTIPAEKITLGYDNFIGWEYSVSNNSVAHKIGKSSDGAGPLEFITNFNPGATGQTFTFKNPVDRLTILYNGNIGIGTITPTTGLEVADTIYSSVGGFKFPDGTVQETAATGGGASSINDLTDGKTGGNSTFLGENAGYNDDGSNNNNTGVGRSALALTTTGSYNTAIGTSVMNLNSEGHSNTALGYYALYSNTTGNGNVGIGLGANRYNQEGSNNTIVGYNAGGGSAAHSKSGNVFIGYTAGRYEPGDNKLYIENSSSSEPLIGGDFNTDDVDLNGEVYVRDRFGVGTTSPSAGIHLLGSGFPESFMYLESTAGNDAGLRFYEGSTAKWHIFNNAASGALQIYNTSAAHTVFFAEQSTGNVGIGTTNPTSLLTVAGTVECDVLEINGGSDIAEPFDITNTNEIKSGMVMTIDTKNPGELKISEQAYDRCVAGIISGAGGINPGMIMGQSGTIADGKYPVALTGRVYCWANASNGSINPGDLLTTSDIPGHAMKVVDYTKAQGAVIGKAMSSLEEGQGLILVLVTLQ